MWIANLFHVLGIGADAATIWMEMGPGRLARARGIGGGGKGCGPYLEPGLGPSFRVLLALHPRQEEYFSGGHAIMRKSERVAWAIAILASTVAVFVIAGRRDG